MGQHWLIMLWRRKNYSWDGKRISRDIRRGSLIYFITFRKRNRKALGSGFQVNSGLLLDEHFNFGLLKRLDPLFGVEVHLEKV